MISDESLQTRIEVYSDEKHACYDHVTAELLRELQRRRGVGKRECLQGDADHRFVSGWNACVDAMERAGREK